MHLRLFLVLIICINTINIKAQSDRSYFPDIVATWLTENKKQKVKVSYNSNTKTYSGHISWMYEDDSAQGRHLYDIKNPNSLLQKRRLTGIKLIYNLKYKSENKFKGYVYDPNSGKEYRCIFSLSTDRKTVEIRAYIFTPLIGRTEFVTKIKDEDEVKK